MKLRAIITIDLDSPITEISDHAKRIETAVGKLKEHYDTIDIDFKERRDREQPAHKVVHKASKKSKKAGSELALSK